jgi:translocator protein
MDRFAPFLPEREIACFLFLFSEIQPAGSRKYISSSIKNHIREHMTIKSVVKSFLTLAGSLAFCLLAGYMGWYPALPGMPVWYNSLVKPIFSPPSWLFSPIWMVFFLLMGFTLFFVLQSGIKQYDVTIGLILFGLQLLFTLVWAFAFFGIHSLFLSFLCIIALWATLLCAIIQIFRFSVHGGMLLIPYFIWVCYLAYVNYGIMVLNNAVYTI